MGIKCLSVIRYSKWFINQIIDKCTIKYDYIKGYKSRVKDLSKKFLALNFQVVRRCHNSLANQLASKVANYEFITHTKPKKEVKLVIRAPMLDNDYHW